MPLNYDSMASELTALKKQVNTLQDRYYALWDKDTMLPEANDDDSRPIQTTVNTDTLTELKRKSEKTLQMESKQAALDAMNKALEAVVKLEDFNRAFAENLTAAFTYRDNGILSEPKELTKTEKLLRDLRKKANDKEDMFVDVMHRLSQRTQSLMQESKLYAKESGEYAKIGLKTNALAVLVTQIKEVASQTPVNPMNFYVAIVRWENENSNKNTMATRRSLPFFKPASASMLDTLKKDLLKQAVTNGDMTRENVSALQQAIKAGTEWSWLQSNEPTKNIATTQTNVATSFFS